MGHALCVLGTGGWGTAAALVALRSGLDVTLWGRRRDHVEALRRDGENRAYLPGVALPPELGLSSDPRAAAAADLLVCAIPTQHIRFVLGVVRAGIEAETPILSLSKGIENGTLARPSQIIGQVLERPRVTVLSGPSFADEVARQLPALLVAASAEEAEACFWQEALSGPTLRVYTGDDPAGVELAGALKNVMAIAAGICDGLALGENAKAALLSRGLVEMSRLGVAMGARRSTFFGISGVGDLIATCYSSRSRNLRVGREVGAGRLLPDIMNDLKMVAEGVWTCTAARDLGRKKGIELPITEEVCRMLYEGKSPHEALRSLMTRVPKSEAPDLG
ncbi:MAG: NAD(P)-dependent glycerol-3-phosphate dehydrogenase [Planctomycetes bacterium]|nr:NAD(P)-dependent glycerol-3-phosphate dehydrogenase [Planctomycetota bacterium]